MPRPAMTKKTFLEKVKEVQPSHISFENVPSLLSIKHPLILVCTKHGEEYSQLYTNTLKGKLGCPACAKEEYSSFHG